MPKLKILILPQGKLKNVFIIWRREKLKSLCCQCTIWCQTFVPHFKEQDGESQLHLRRWTLSISWRSRCKELREVMGHSSLIVAYSTRFKTMWPHQFTTLHPIKVDVRSNVWRTLIRSSLFNLSTCDNTRWFICIWIDNLVHIALRKHNAADRNCCKCWS